MKNLNLNLVFLFSFFFSVSLNAQDKNDGIAYPTEGYKHNDKIHVRGVLSKYIRKNKNQYQKDGTYYVSVKSKFAEDGTKTSIEKVRMYPVVIDAVEQEHQTQVRFCEGEYAKGRQYKKQSNGKFVSDETRGNPNFLFLKIGEIRFRLASSDQY